MNQQLIQQQLQDWLVDFVEKSNPLLDGWAPCPYARKARVNGRFDVKFATADNLEAVINSAAAQLDQRDVVAVCINSDDITAQALEEFVAEQNKKHMPNDVLLLEDHPDAVEMINGVHMNFGPCALVLVQQLSKINEASDQLQKAGYYKHWSQENLDSVVSWRVNNEHDLLPNQSQ